MTGGFSLRWRILGVMALVFALGVAAALISYRHEVRSHGRDLRSRTLQEQARELAAVLRVTADGKVRFLLPPAAQLAYADPASGFAYTLYDRSGAAVAQSPNLHAPLPDLAVPAGADFAPITLAGAGAAQKAVIALRLKDGRVLVAGRREADFKRLVDSLFQEHSEELLILAPFALLALGLIWVIGAWSLRPLTRASREAASVGPADPERRISAAGLPREIRPLVDAVNGALDRLAAAYAAERRMTEDAAHGLRTPLAVLSLRLQKARRSGAADWPAIEQDLAQLASMVGKLLDLSRKDSAARQQDALLPMINLARVAREAAAAMLPLIETAGRHLETDIPDRLRCRGHADDLGDLLRNLLENALRHGSGVIRLSLRAEPGRLVVEVGDEGPGVPRGQEEAVFARFRKLDGAAPGAGLGLAIVREVARRHGGEATFRPGRGQVVVTLPTPSEAELSAAPRRAEQNPAPSASRKLG